VKVFWHIEHIKGNVGSHRLLEGLSSPANACDEMSVAWGASMLAWALRALVDGLAPTVGGDELRQIVSSSPWTTSSTEPSVPFVYSVVCIAPALGSLADDAAIGSCRTFVYGLAFVVGYGLCIISKCRYPPCLVSNSSGIVAEPFVLKCLFSSSRCNCCSLDVVNRTVLNGTCKWHTLVSFA